MPLNTRATPCRNCARNGSALISYNQLHGSAFAHRQVYSDLDLAGVAGAAMAVFDEAVESRRIRISELCSGFVPRRKARCFQNAALIHLDRGSPNAAGAHCSRVSGTDLAGPPAQSTHSQSPRIRRASDNPRWKYPAKTIKGISPRLPAPSRGSSRQSPGLVELQKT